MIYSNLNMHYSYLSTREAGNRTVTAVCFTLPANALLPQLSWRRRSASTTLSSPSPPPATPKSSKVPAHAHHIYNAQSAPLAPSLLLPARSPLPLAARSHTASAIHAVLSAAAVSGSPPYVPHSTVQPTASQVMCSFVLFPDSGVWNPASMILGQVSCHSLRGVRAFMCDV